MAKKGKLIVFEGADGSGKTTQSKLLVEYLKSKKTPYAYLSFPRYEGSMWAQMVKRYLFGEFGKINEVDGYFASMLYAGDRLSAKDEIKKWIDEGKIVICNRYVPSNLAHMSAKMKSQSEKSKYKVWLEKLEYGENKIPREDLVIFLRVPISVTRKLMKKRNLDIHESNLKYQEKVLAQYELLSDLNKNWAKVNCSKEGKILKPQEVHKMVLEVLKDRKIL